MNAPEVSVVMGVYNGAEYLEQTLDGILSQQGCELEFVVVNDGSTDETGRILDQRALQDNRLRVIHQQNAGLTRALIRGCAEAQGEFIARQDAGDVSLPGRLSAQCARLRTDADTDADTVAVSAHTNFIGPAGEALYTTTIPEAALNTGLLMARDGRHHGPTHHGSVMMRRSVYEAVGGYRVAFYFAQDLDLWSRLVEKGRFAVVDAVCYQARLDPQAISSTQSPEQRRLAELITLATKARRSGQPEDKFLELASMIRPVNQTCRASRIAAGNYFIGSCLVESDPIAARAYLKSAFIANPTHFRALAKLIACELRLRFSVKHT